MKEENKNKYLSLEEYFPSLFRFLQWCLPSEEREEWIGDVDEKLNERTEEKKYSQWKIKWMYILEILPILNSAREMGYLRWDKWWRGVVLWIVERLVRWSIGRLIDTKGRVTITTNRTNNNT